VTATPKNKSGVNAFRTFFKEYRKFDEKKTRMRKYPMNT
jgi:hypothetical protein